MSCETKLEEEEERVERVHTLKSLQHTDCLFHTHILLYTSQDWDTRRVPEDPSNLLDFDKKTLS